MFVASKNEDEDYYILTLAAIAKELAIRGMDSADVLLALGLPLNWLANQKKDFAEYLMRKQEVDFKFCNVQYHIRICDVKVYPQGYAGIVAALPAYKGVHMLADIGNGTMNTLVITNGRPISDRMYTDKIGVHQCVKRIYNAVQAECGKLPDESLIEDFLRNRTADTSNRILSVMQMEAEKYTQEIFDKLSEYEYDPEMVRLHIIGGGGCLIRNFGAYDSDNVEIITDICATAKGYESLYILNAEKQEVESFIESASVEVSGTREAVEESKQQLAEINEQIADKEKRYETYEKKIDKILEAEKDVEKVLGTIRKNTKPLPTLRGKESAIRITKKDFEKLMKMAKAAGTLSKLNEIYEKELGKLKIQIDRLTSQLGALKDKISAFEEFVDWKGLKKEFKEFIPKSVIRKIQRNKDNLAEINSRPKIIKVKSKEHDEAI